MKRQHLILKYLPLLTVMIFVACGGEKADKAASLGKTGNPAIDHLTELLITQPNNDSLYAARAKLFYENDLYDEAVHDLAIAMKTDSLNIPYHYLLADVYMDMANSRLAIATMERAVQINPENIHSLLKLAEFQHILRMHNESMKTVDQILRLEPNNDEAYFMMGMNFREIGDTTRAIASFQKSFENNDQNIDACINIGLLWERKNNPIALKYYDAALRLDSFNTQALYSKAMYYQNRFDDKKALEIYKKINTSDPHFVDAYFNTGILYLEMDSVKKAYDHFNIVVNEDPLYINGYYYRGLTGEKLGKKAEALKDYKQVLGMSPSFEKAKEAVSRLESN